MGQFHDKLSEMMNMNRTQTTIHLMEAELSEDIVLWNFENYSRMWTEKLLVIINC